MRPLLGLALAAGCAPLPADLAIHPSTADTTDRLKAVWQTDEEPRHLRYAWARNGAVLLDLHKSTVPAERTERGQTWTVTVTSDDGILERAKRVIGNAPPQVEPTLHPSQPNRSSGVQLDPASLDPDGDRLTLSTTWAVADQVISETGLFLDGTFFERGDAIQATVVATDGESETTSIVSVVAVNGVPTIETVAITPADPTREHALRCETHAWSDADDDPPAFRYTWYLNSVDLELNALELATELFRGDEVVCEATPWDGHGHGEVHLSTPVLIQNSRPALTSAHVDAPAEIYEDTLLSCVGSGFSDVDGDPWVDSRFQWWVNAAPIWANGPTLDGADFDHGDLVACRIAPDDGFEIGNFVNSTPVEILNSPPTNVVVTVDPDPVYPHDRVVCRVSADDVDDDELIWTITWERDGLPFVDTETTDEPDDTIGAYKVGFDELWRCEATPDDGQVLGATQGADFETDPPIGGNILVIVADDLGLDHVLAYGLADEAPPTPTLDGLAADGVLFENAYAYAVCSPTRAALMTSRYGSRTGSGDAIRTLQSTYELPLEEVTLPEMLRQSPWFFYANSGIGKWHISAATSPSGALHPNLSGFDDYRGSAGNLVHGVLGLPTSYFFWEKVINGTVTLTKSYATTETTDDTIDRITVMPEPWFAYVAYNAPHGPWHVPPPHLHSYVGLDNDSPIEMRYDATVEALDTEIGRLLDAMPADLRARTTVIFMGDNGTPDKAITEPFDPLRSKDTPYEGGIKVPMIVTGPLVSQPGTRTAALVHAVDIYPTMAHIAGVRMGDMTKLDLEGETVPIAFDGQSLARWLADPAEPSIRDMIYAEKFSPNYGPDYYEDISIGRNDRWKLITTDDGSEFFDLESAVLDEGVDLLTVQESLDPEQQEAFDELRNFIGATKSTLVYEGPPSE